MFDNKEWDFKSFRILKKEYGDFKGMYIGEICFEKGAEKFILQISKDETYKILSVVEGRMPHVLNKLIAKYKQEI